jgi:hypothetical protein
MTKRKRTNKNALQNTTQKTKDRTPQKCPWWTPEGLYVSGPTNFINNVEWYCYESVKWCIWIFSS